MQHQGLGRGAAHSCSVHLLQRNRHSHAATHIWLSQPHPPQTSCTPMQTMHTPQSVHAPLKRPGPRLMLKQAAARQGPPILVPTPLLHTWPGLASRALPLPQRPPKQALAHTCRSHTRVCCATHGPQHHMHNPSATLLVLLSLLLLLRLTPEPAFSCLRNAMHAHAWGSCCRTGCRLLTACWWLCWCSWGCRCWVAARPGRCLPGR
jgi:hypothetical protein